VSTPKQPSTSDLLEKIMRGTTVPRELLLGELDALLRSRPNGTEIKTRADDVLAWRGRAAAVLKQWNSAESFRLDSMFMSIDTGNRVLGDGYAQLIALLHQARHSIQMEMLGPQSVVMPEGRPHEYFEAVRAIVERASQEVMFIDQYLEADFAGRYLPFVAKGVSVRLLSGRRYLSKLLPAVEMFVKQSGTAVAVRTADFHDRYVFIDGRECHKSGGSFKDGATNDPTSLVQIVDAFDVTRQIYEAKWNAGQVERA
jgi:hypothetical protein